jgi:ABC-type dipeptide/oligopeptide/nickel transport system ATPase subunit
MQLSDEARLKKIAICGRVFSPAAPVNRLKLFAGRIKEVRLISEAVATRGRHAIMYGDRGVGKTSLATVLKELFSETEGHRIVKVNCVESDSFHNIWRKALSSIPYIWEPSPAASNGVKSIETTLDEYLGPQAGPGEVRSLLAHVSQEDSELIVVFDEFDRLVKSERVLFPDTIKDLSDNSVSTTLVLVGVANDVVELIDEHESISRCITQIKMPPMNSDELSDILSKALSALEMSIDDEARWLIVSLSQGLPHYTHLLGQESAQNALQQRRLKITLQDVEIAIKRAIEKTEHTTRNAYQLAVHAQREGTLFSQVLLACALADVDELGYFNSTAVRGPLCELTGKAYDIPNFSPHLAEFCDEKRRVLEKWGTKRRFKFRFRNALLRPFVIMKGLADRAIPGSLISRLTERPPARDTSAETQGPLFD